MNHLIKNKGYHSPIKQSVIMKLPRSRTAANLRANLQCNLADITGSPIFNAILAIVYQQHLQHNKYQGVSVCSTFNQTKTNSTHMEF